MQGLHHGICETDVVVTVTEVTKDRVNDRENVNVRVIVAEEE
jgi:hypothetical protein